MVDKSTDSSSLREHHKQLTRDLIMEATADVIADVGLDNLSIQMVADKAGLSHRTIYRHFPNRETLLDKFMDWIEEAGTKQGEIDNVPSADDLSQAVKVNFAIWDEHSALTSEMAKIYLGTKTPIDDKHRRRRSDYFRKIIGESAPNADPADVQVTSIIVRYLASSLTWAYLNNHYGMNGKESSELIAGAIDTLLRDLKDKSNQATQNNEGEDVL